MSLRDYELLRAATLEEEVRCSLYVAGPMTGKPYLNFPAFDAAAADLRGRGYPVISPAELDAPGVRELVMQNHTGAHMDIPGHSWQECLARDLVCVTQVDAIACLEGWEESQGATFEVAVALKLGKTIYAYGPERGTLCHMELIPQITVCPA